MLVVIFAKKQGRMIAERKMGVRKRAFASWDFYLKEPIFFSFFPTSAQRGKNFLKEHSNSNRKSSDNLVVENSITVLMENCVNRGWFYTINPKIGKSILESTHFVTF